MSAVVKLSSKLGADPETNGLDSLAGDLLANPHQVTCAIVWLVVDHITEDVAGDGARVPTVQVKRIEPVATVAKTPDAIQTLAAELYQRRLNKQPLPFDVVDVVEGGYVNPDTDEVERADA